MRTISWWRRLWVKLALFGAVGATLTLGLHLAAATQLTTRALTRQLAAQAQTLGDLVARSVADHVLEADAIRVQQVIELAGRSSRVGYCFVEKDGRVLASSFVAGTPSALLRLPADERPLIIDTRRGRFLQVQRPVLSWQQGRVFVGLRLDVLGEETSSLAAALVALTLAVIVTAVILAFVVGRRVAAAAGTLTGTLERFDPRDPYQPVRIETQDELGLLSGYIDTMCHRLRQGHLEEQRARRQQMQTEKLAALGTLVAGVAHEVNNPLAGLKNVQRRLASAKLAEAQRAQYLELMKKGLQRIEQVVRQMLEFSRPQPPRVRAEALGKIVGRAVDLLRPVIDAKRVTVVVDLQPLDQRVLTVDPGQIEQALTNLVLNALYVSAPGQQITIEARERPGQVGVAVRDRGPGIAPELRQEVMNPFFSTKPEGEGTGLGLSVTRSIAESHDGEIEIDCPGTGTVVTLWLPLGEAPPTA